MKALVWLLLGLLVYWALRSQAKRNQDKRRQARGRDARERDFDAREFDAKIRGATRSAPSSSTPVENMVACSYCQLYLPASEAIHSVISASDHYFCGEEHASLYKDNPQK